MTSPLLRVAYSQKDNRYSRLVLHNTAHNSLITDKVLMMFYGSQKAKVIVHGNSCYELSYSLSTY